MKRALAFLVLCVMLVTIGTPVLAADPDYWGVDSNRQNIGTLDSWEPVGDGVSDGMGYFPDFGMALLFMYGKNVARHFGWAVLRIMPF